MNNIDLPYKKDNINLFNEHLKKIDFLLKDYIPPIEKESYYTAVIFELRPLEELVPIVKNHMYFLNENKNSNIKWGLQIVHGTDNEEFIINLFRDFKNITFTNLGIKNFESIWSHTQILKRIEFWESLIGEKILLFQTDSLLLKFGIDEFISYDYIGGPWIKPKDGCYVGNGGLSLRTKKTMIEIIKEDQEKDNNWEDIFFSIKLEGKNKPDVEIAKKFSMEDHYYNSPFGLHKPHKIKTELLKKILDENVQQYTL